LQKIIIVSGYFNPIHKGHLEYFINAKSQGKLLFVIVNSDFQRELKGSKEFQKELKSIPDEEFQKDILHVSQIERVTQNPNVPYREVSIDELRKMSPTANKAFERIEARKKITPKTVDVPSEQLPVGSGETKVSRLEARARGIKDDINKLTEAEAEELESVE
jgi:cytidyltransferase-like protein